MIGSSIAFFQTSEGDTQQNPPTPMSRATLQDLTRLLGESSAIFGGALLDLEDSDESADEDPDYEEVEYEQADEDYAIRRLYQRPAQFSPVLQPQEAGLKLLMGGEFGRVGQRLASRRNNVNIAKLLLDRGTMPLPATCKEDITSVCAVDLPAIAITHRTLRISYLILMAPRWPLPLPISIRANFLEVCIVQHLHIAAFHCLPRFFILLHMRSR